MNKTQDFRDYEYKMKNLIECSNLGTWEWNVHTGEFVFNDTWARIIGYTLEELAPATIKAWETFTHPDDLKASKEILERHFGALTMDFQDNSFAFSRFDPKSLQNKRHHTDRLDSFKLQVGYRLIG